MPKLFRLNKYENEIPFMMKEVIATNRKGKMKSAIIIMNLAIIDEIL